MMRTTLVSGLGILVWGLASCNTVRTASSETPRVETEVVYEVGEGFYAPLAGQVDRAAIEALLREAVAPIADVGLRFYPVPAEQYADGSPRPDYIMTIRAIRLEPNRELSRRGGNAEEGVEPTVEAKVTSVRCVVTTKVERRRDTGPRLPIGEAEGQGRASPSKAGTGGAEFPLERQADEENDTTVDEKAIGRAFVAAAERAFAILQKPVDRELKQRGAEAKKASADATGR